MEIRSVKIDALATCGNTAIVKYVRPKTKYIENKPTTEKEGFTIACVLPERGYEELVVTVPAVPSELENLTGNRNPIVCFDGLRLSIYLYRKDKNKEEDKDKEKEKEKDKEPEYRISAKANAVHIVESKEKA